MLFEATKHVVSIRHLDPQRAALLQRSARLGEDALVLDVVEVSERREPADDTVEPVTPRKRTHVTLDVVDLHASLGSGTTPELEEASIRVEAGDAYAVRGESFCDAAVPAAEVEEVETRLEAKQAPDRVGIPCGLLGRQRRLVEVEVVLVERLLEIERAVRHGVILSRPSRRGYLDP